ncbi:MAG: EAL domain-containing protein [Betaproteobacteria bacterium]|nr:EAL domain-containing protein [Betaproteobacteria bacterium]
MIELPTSPPRDQPAPAAQSGSRARRPGGFAPAAALAGMLAILLLGFATGNWAAALAGSAVAAAATAIFAVVAPQRRRPGAPARPGPTPPPATRKFSDTVSRGVKGIHRYIGQLAGRPALLRQPYQPTRNEDDLDSRQRRRVVRHLTRAQRIARVGSWEWRPKSDRISWSAEVYRIAGVRPTEFRPVGAAVLDLVHPLDRRALRRWLVALARGRVQPGLDLRLVDAAGAVRHAHLLGEPLLDASGRARGVVGTVQEATERTRSYEEVHRLAYFDVLTALPNRARFDEKLEQTLQRARRQGQAFALMFLDLDQFKRINDTLGHAVGDELLRIIAQRLTRVLRLDHGKGATDGEPAERDLCRRGGDEFIVLLDGVADDEAAGRVAQRVLESLAKPVTLGKNQVFVSASIGVVLFPRDGADLDTLLMNADVAMYQAKSRGRNRYSFYDESMRTETARRLLLESDLRIAVEAQQFELHYQPQFDVRSGAILGVEALLRWNHPGQGQLNPTQFITVAEETGLIMPIWEWVLVSVLIQHNRWREMGLGAIPIAVNLSAAQLVDPALAERLQDIARVVDVPARYIELEVTESMLMVDYEAALHNLNRLRALGIKIAIDDFGTGYSSLSYLRRLPFDKLKLDQSFTQAAAASAHDAAITRAIITMAQSLDVVVVAEGVETRAQFDFLAALGCTTMQGFLLGHPAPGAEIAVLLREHRHPPGTGIDGEGCAPGAAEFEVEPVAARAAAAAAPAPRSH